MTIRYLVDRLSARLRDDLPGKDIQHSMLARSRISISPKWAPEQAKPSAVLILLFPRNETPRFFLTQRTNDVAHHKGQIALPGGAWEEGERLSETALRETHEEIGIRSEEGNLLGSLTPLFVPVTGFIIHPFVGWVDHEPDTRIDTREVEHLFSVSIDSLLNDQNQQQEQRTIRGIPMDIPFFDLEKRHVWGATAMILVEFKSILRDIL